MRLATLIGDLLIILFRFFVNFVCRHKFMDGRILKYEVDSKQLQWDARFVKKNDEKRQQQTNNTMIQYPQKY